MKELLPKLGERLKDFRDRASKLTVPKFELKKVTDSDKQITHDWLWWRLGAWFEKNDLIITEAGTFMDCLSHVRSLTFLFYR